MRQATLTARMPDREFAIVAWKAGLLDCSRSEIARYALLRLGGTSHDEAREMVLGQRRPATYSDNETDRPISVTIPPEWLDRARANHPDLNRSTLFRYAVTRLGLDDEAALEMSRRTMGPKPKTQGIENAA